MTTDSVDPLPLRQPDSRKILARCLSYLRPYWRYTAAAYLLLLINSGIMLVQPLIIRNIVDQGIRGGESSVIQMGALLLVGLTLVKGLFTFLYGRWTEIASQNVAYDLRNAIHAKLQSLSFSYHDQAETGQLLTRAISDVDRVRFLTGRAFLRLIEIIVLIVGIAVSMLLMNVRLALLTLIVVPVIWAASSEQRKATAPATAYGTSAPSLTRRCRSGVSFDVVTIRT